MDLKAAVGDGAAIGVQDGEEILAFVRAILKAEPADAIAATRNVLVSQAGEAVAADAAGVCAHFNGINRVADGTGVTVNDFITPADELQEYLRARHGADRVTARLE